MRALNSNPSFSPLPKIWKVGTLSYTGAGLAILFCWLLWGDFSYQMRDRTIPPVMQLLFRKFGASDMLTGVLFSSLPAAIGLIVGPVVGYQSDRLRTRWGRRIPFLLVPLPVILVSILGLAFSPQIGSCLNHYSGTLFSSENNSILFCMGTFWMVFEIAQMVANATYGGLINDVVPQAVIGRFFGLFRVVSLSAAMVFNYFMMGQAETHSGWIFLGVGLLYGVGFTLMCLNVKEGKYPPVELAEERTQNAGSAIKTYFRDGFGNSFYLWYFATTVLGGLVGLPITLYGVFYAKSIGMSMDAYGKCYTLSYGISLCAAYPLSVLADRFHPVRTTFIAIALHCLFVAVICYHGITSIGFFGFVLVCQIVLLGAYLTSASSLGQRLLPRSKFTEMASVGGLLNGLASMFLAPAVGELLDQTNHGYQEIFYLCLLTSALALAASFILYRKFMLLGGPEHYVAPT